jgi:tetratricopeptide (TPR) repeat protein
MPEGDASSQGGGAAGGHFTEEELTALILGRLPRRRRLQLVRHLARGCGICQATSRRVFASTQGRRQAAPVGATPEELDRAFAGAAGAAELRARQLAWERIFAWAMWCDLENLSPAEREARVRREPAFHTWGMYERLLEASVWYRRNDPPEAVDIVTLAVQVAENIPASHIPGRAAGRPRLLAEAWTHQANALRMAAEFARARQALDQAWYFWKESRDPETEAGIYELEAMYHADMGDFGMAEVVAGQALDIFRQLGSKEHQGRTLLVIGQILLDAEPERSRSLLQRGLELIDPQASPYLRLSGEHNQVWCLAAMGQGVEALAALEQVRPLYRQFEHDAFVQLRLHWLEGRVARCLGRVAEAAQIYARLGEQFEALDMRHEKVLVALDEAEALLACGDWRAAVQVLARVTPLMVAWRLSTYTVEAWLLLMHAVEKRQQRRIDSLLAQAHLYFRQRWKVPTEFTPVDRG